MLIMTKNQKNLFNILLESLKIEIMFKISAGKKQLTTGKCEKQQQLVPHSMVNNVH